MRNSFLVAACFSLSSCYLTSKAPAVQKTVVPKRDELLNRQLNLILNNATQVMRDISRTTSFIAGAAAPSEDPQSFTDLPEYTTLFAPVESKALDWNEANPNRFSREIWNESVYLLRRANPHFRIRAEGRIETSTNKEETIDALALMADSGKEISAENSTALLSARSVCIPDYCTGSIRISHKAIAKMLALEKVSNGAWGGSSGSIVATVTATETAATMEDFVLTSEKMNLIISHTEYKRKRSTNESIIKAVGRIALKGVPNPLLPNGTYTLERNFEVSGNIRNPSSIVVSFSKVAEGASP
jgi:hypothetical protein